MKRRTALMTSSLISAFVLATSVAQADPSAYIAGSAKTASDAPMYHQVATATKVDIVDTAVQAGSFKTLVAAIKAAGLVETLKGKGPFTVFAPTDNAFAQLPKGTLAMLLKPENKAKLQAILTYHVVPGNVPAADVVGLDGQSVATVNGAELAVTIEGDTVMVDDATVTATDITASNGIIHVIDNVLIP